MESKGKCRQIVATLKDEILSGKYAVRSTFPSIAQIIRRFGVSNLTAVKVHDKLKVAGLIRSYQGRGTFVSRQGTARKIGVIMPGIATSEFFRPIAATIIRLARQHDCELQFVDVYSANALTRVRETKDLVADFIRRRVSGVIFQPLEYASDQGATNRRILTLFEKVGIPVVLLDSEIVPSPGRTPHDLVSIDNVSAGRLLAGHLLERGARSIHFLMRTNWYPNILGRLDGVISALAEQGIGWTKSNLLVAEPNDVMAVRRHFRRRPRPDAFVCECDPTAAVFLKTMESLGVRVPQDLLVASFDDVNLARLTSPSLTSVRQPYEQIAETVFMRLLERIRHPELAPVSIFLPVTLSIRKSTEATRSERMSEGRTKGR